MSRESNLQYFPQVIKAIIMASSVHNVDSENTEGGSPLVSDKDGAGAINAALADTIVSNGWRISSVIAANSSETTHFINVAAGERVRLVLAWLSHTGPGSSYNTDVLKTNLDLRIEDPNGNYITQSTSTVDNFELVEFTPSSSGLYKVKVIRTSSNGIAVLEDYGIAWARMGTYLPDVRFDHNGWDSTITIRNNDAQPRNVTITLLNADGSYRFGWSYLSLQPNATLSYNPDTFGHNVDNWSGAAVVDGSEDLSMVVETEANSRRERQNYTGVLSQGSVGSPGWEKVGTQLYAPVVKRNYYSRSTALNITNTGSQATTVEVKFYRQSGGTPRTITFSLAPGARSTQFASSGGGSGGCDSVNTLCSAVIQSLQGQPLAVSVDEYQDGSGYVAIDYNAFSMGNSTLYFPIVKNHWYGMITGLGIQNLSDQPTTASITAYELGGSVRCNRNVPLNPRGMVVFYDDTCFQDPDDPHDEEKRKFLGSVVVTADQPLVGMGNEVSLDGRYKKAYSAFLAGSRSASAPLFYNSFVEGGYTWQAGIMVQNLSTQTANLTLTYHNTSGVQVGTQTASLAGRGSQAFSAPLSNFKGSVRVTADRDIAAVVNIVHNASTGDAHALYNAPSR